MIELAWLADWKYRCKITIDSTKIDAGLSWFPILVYISGSCGKDSQDMTCIFDEVGANKLKIAFTKADGTTQLYAEIEKWDEEEEQAWIWVSREEWDIDSGADTDFYIYYDNTKADNNAWVGIIESVPAMAVWDDDFKAVYHMRDKTTASVADSTSNNNDATKKAANQPLVTVNGEIDDAQHFDREVPHWMTSIIPEIVGSVFTIEAWAKLDTTIGEQDVTSGQGGDGTGRYAGRIRYLGPAPWLWYNFNANRADTGPRVNVNDTLFHYLAGVCNGTTRRLYLDANASVNTVEANNGWFDVDRYFGRQDRDGRYYEGILDEIRFSLYERSAAWLKASYYSGADNLVSWTACPCEEYEESEPEPEPEPEEVEIPTGGEEPLPPYIYKFRFTSQEKVYGSIIIPDKMSPKLIEESKKLLWQHIYKFRFTPSKKVRGVVVIYGFEETKKIRSEICIWFRFSETTPIKSLVGTNFSYSIKIESSVIIRIEETTPVKSTTFIYGFSETRQILAPITWEFSLTIYAKIIGKITTEEKEYLNELRWL